MYLIIFSFIVILFTPLIFNKNVSHINILTFIRCFGICLIVLPLSYIYTKYTIFQNKLRFLLYSTPKLHDEKIKQITKQVKGATMNHPGVLLCTGRPGWQNMSPHNAKYKKEFNKIYIDLYDILEVNTSEKYIRVEPMVNMYQITSTLIPMGWTLPVLPELDDLTIGGVINGCGIETSSHKYGLFQNICIAFEIVLPNGKYVKCSKDENPDLFYSIPWSHGTLGFLVGAYIQIIPAKSYVALEYYSVKGSIDSISEKFKQCYTETSCDFIEGLIYSSTEAIIMKGNMVDNIGSDGNYNPVNAFYKPWFYLYVQDMLPKNGSNLKDNENSSLVFVRKDYIPLKQYYHRHTKSLFWELEHMIPFGNHYFFRYTFGWMLPLKISFIKLTLTQKLKEIYQKLHIAQDILVPSETLAEFLTYSQKNFDLYPIWLCPMKLFSVPGMIHPGGDEESKMYIDIGLYGMPKSKSFIPVQSLHNLEQLLIAKNGFEMFYGDVYLSQNELETMLDMKLYEKLRGKYDCENRLPHIFDKINRSARG